MKIKIIFCLVFNTILLKSYSHVFLINLNDSSFTYNEKKLNADDKTCYVFNCLSKKYNKSGNLSIKPLILFKVFGYTGTKSNISKPTRVIAIKDYVTSTVLPKLTADMLLKANFEIANSDPNFHLIDSLVIYDGKSYKLIEGSVVILEFFNIYPYKQKDPLQTNQSVLNIAADTIKIYEWVGDHLPIPNIEAMIDGRMFLLKKENKDYTFFRHPFDCSDCPLSFYNEYIYRKDYGVVGFRSKYLQYNSDSLSREMFGKIIESDKYYYFK